LLHDKANSSKWFFKEILENVDGIFQFNFHNTGPTSKKSDSNIEIDHIFLVNHTLCPDLPEKVKIFFSSSIDQTI
jgi:hypothetical protein